MSATPYCLGQNGHNADRWNTRFQGNGMKKMLLCLIQIQFILFRSTNILNKKKDIISEEHLVLQGYYASIYRERRLFLWVITEPVSTVDIYRISKIYR